MSEEVGEELLFDDLKLKQIVVLIHCSTGVTAWVNMLDPERRYAGFYMGEIGVNLLLFTNDKRQFFDDSGKHIHVHRYLGDV